MQACKGNVDIAPYREILKATTEFAKKNTGVMMREGHFVEFYKSAPGGCHSDGEALAKWQAMTEEVEAGYRLSDEDGPNEKKPLRVWVATGTEVNRTDRQILEKTT